MNIIYKTVLLLLCTTGIAHAGIVKGYGDNRTEACANARSSNHAASSCDCSDRGEDYSSRWICAVNWDDSNSRSSSSSSYDSSPSRFQNTTPPGQRFVPIQIPQRSSYLLPGSP